jgi:GT2 family glycosyltransferase
VTEAKAEPLVAAVVLNWDGREMTIQCLESLSASRWGNLRPIVVDNASTDGSPAAISDRFPDVEVIVNPQNLGFAEGNNVGIRRALEIGADYVLVLNNDTLVDPQAVRRLVGAAQAHPDAGALSPLIYFADPPDLIWFAGADFDPSRGRAGRMLGYRERDDGSGREIRDTDRLTGAAMLVTREAAEETGMFDGDLFFLYEDVDWSLRMRAGGFRLYVVPEAKVWHRVAATQKGEYSPLSVYYGMRNQLTVSRRHAPLGRVGSTRRVLTAIAINAARLRHSHDRRRGARALVAGIVDGLRGRLGPWERGD